MIKYCFAINGYRHYFSEIKLVQHSRLPIAVVMTVTYIQDVDTAGRVETFMRLLAKWKGGVAKGIWIDLLIYLASYATISLVYRFLFSLDEDIKAGFEKFCVFTGKYTDYIPLGFILGFYVTQVVNRWWTQVMTIPWLDSLCMKLADFMPGNKMKKTRRLVTRLGDACQHSHIEKNKLQCLQEVS